jgi:polyribonucleotide nucleotidyltransferase
MASAPAGAQGVRDALDILVEKKRITPEENLERVQNLNPFAPRIITMQINPDKIKDVIGSGGKVNW